MKYNQKFQAYGRSLIRKVKSADFQYIQEVRQHLSDIQIFIQGIVQEVGKDGSVNPETFDYTAYDRYSRGYYRRIETNVYDTYDKIARGIERMQKSVWVMYREELENALQGVKLKSTVSEDMSVIFGGTPNEQFTKYLRLQLQAGQDPATLIKTVSQEHVKLIQKQMMTAVSKGKGFGWATDKVLKEMYPSTVDKQLRKQMEYNITRILRTSYMQAVNADTNGFILGNPEVFYGSRRTADGRPCVACIVLDGVFYPPGKPLIDHPNGQCILVPLMYPDEYFLTGKITKDPKDTFDVPLVEKFYRMPEDQQRKIFGNNSLFALWKAEKFALSSLVTGLLSDTNVGVMSYRQAVLSLPNLGGVSFPKASFLPGTMKLNAVLDPIDRADESLAIAPYQEKNIVNKYGVGISGNGSDVLQSRMSETNKAKLLALFGMAESMHWSTFNMRARMLGLWLRMATDGAFYLAIPISET